MDTIRSIANYLLRFLKQWIIWFWFFALDGLGLIVDTFAPAWSVPRWLYWTIPIIGIVVANVKLFVDLESEMQQLRSLIVAFTDDAEANRTRFQELQDLMPDLVSEMRVDLLREDGKFIREFWLVSKKWTMNWGPTRRFIYYYEDHDDLDGKIQILENYGFVFVVKSGTAKIYRMTEKFVELLVTD